MKLQSILTFIACFILAISLSSCKGTMIGIGFSQNRGNLLFEEDEPIVKRTDGAYVEYRWKQMVQKNWTNTNARSGYGIDYNFTLKGYGVPRFQEGADDFFHSIQCKYYYTILPMSSTSKRIDLAFGLGSGHFPLSSRFKKLFPVVTNLSIDFYFPKTKFLYLTPKVNYVHNLKDHTYNLSFEIGVGIAFEEL